MLLLGFVVSQVSFSMETIALGLTLLTIAIWIGLLAFRGQFWRSDQQLSPEIPELAVWPTIHAIVPARNEAEVLPATLPSLLQQDYPGCFQVVLVDDQSTDGTTIVAQQLAEQIQLQNRLTLGVTEPLPVGWSGKLWAVEQGIRLSRGLSPEPDYWLLTDADIQHDRHNLRQLVAKAEQSSLDLVSLMVQLRCESFWEQWLIPAFVFFFEKLYPFAWVNNPHRATAAAAGGCILIRRTALARIGGIPTLRQALIDDCALAQAVKSTGGKLWLGLSSTTRSLRPYPNLISIWEMVARTAFTQLHYSPWLLLGTVLAMTLIYLVAPVGTIVGLLTQQWLLALSATIGWLLMALAYWPTVSLYRLNPLFSLGLPMIAGLYTLMTVDSALRHWRGQGGAWKGRVYGASMKEE